MATESAHSARNEERRQHPRYARRLSAMVDGLLVFTSQVSLAGMQLLCPEMQLPSLRRALEKRSFRLDIDLPDNNQVSCQVEIAYQSMDGDELLIGVNITGFAKGHRKRWENYLAGLTGPTIN
jgi:hypothetical protein